MGVGESWRDHLQYRVASGHGGGAPSVLAGLHPERRSGVPPRDPGPAGLPAARLPAGHTTHGTPTRQENLRCHRGAPPATQRRHRLVTGPAADTRRLRSPCFAMGGPQFLWTEVVLLAGALSSLARPNLGSSVVWLVLIKLGATPPCTHTHTAWMIS